MKIVIEIDEEKYNYIKKQVSCGIDNPLKVCIANGIPLPKGHGRLIDADKIGLTDFECLLCNGDYKEALIMLEDKIKNADTIIPADIRENRTSEGHYEYGVFQCGLHCVGKFSTKREADIVCEAYNKNVGRTEYIVMQRLVMAWEGVPENV